MKRVYSVLTLALVASSGAVIAQTLPQSLTGLGLTDVEVKDKAVSSFGTNVRGTLPSGARVAIDLDGDGKVQEVEAIGRDTFTIDTVESLLPPAIVANADWPADARFESIDFDSNGRVEIEGLLPDGRDFDAEFSADGELIGFDED